MTKIDLFDINKFEMQKKMNFKSKIFAKNLFTYSYQLSDIF